MNECLSREALEEGASASFGMHDWEGWEMRCISDIQDDSRDGHSIMEEDSRFTQNYIKHFMNSWLCDEMNFFIWCLRYSSSFSQPSRMCSGLEGFELHWYCGGSMWSRWKTQYVASSEMASLSYEAGLDYDDDESSAYFAMILNRRGEAGELRIYRM